MSWLLSSWSLLSSWLLFSCIFATFICTTLSLPAKSFTVKFPSWFLVNVAVNTFLSSDNVHPDTSCISSLAVTVTITLPVVGSVVLYFTVNSGGVVSFEVSCLVFVIYFILLFFAYSSALLPSEQTIVTVSHSSNTFVPKVVTESGIVINPKLIQF